MLTRIFGHAEIPKEYHRNFIHSYMDIAWFGVLSGSALNFLTIYVTRLGGTAFQIGLMGATSAVVTLFLAIPAGRWIEKRPIGPAVFWSSVLFRMGYFLWIPLPWLFDAQGQIAAFIVLGFLMSIPVTALGVGFNALFAEAVPDQYRAHVASVRNMTLAISFMGTSLLSGYILQHMPFPTGYQVIFGIGAFGAAMSSLHIFFIRSLQADSPATQTAPQADPVPPARSPRGIASAMRLDIWSTPFRNVLLALMVFHLAHTLTTPVYPLYNVRVLGLNDNNLGTGTALYYLTMLIGSFQFRRYAHRFGHKKITGIGTAGMAIYPLLLAFSQEVWQFYLISLIGGFTWAWVNGAYANYMLERIPPADRPSHLAWYTIVMNIALLGSSFIGPLVANMVGLVAALVIFAIVRILAGIGILKWG